MIWESCYWKDPLLESASRLEVFSMSKNMDESELVQIEKDMFIGFYTIRKLMDTVKIKDSTKDLKVKICWSPSLKQVNYLNNYKIHDLYDLHTARYEIRTLKFLCDQFVHSYIFITQEKEMGGISGFYFTSDRDKEKKIFYVTVQDVINVFNLVGNDYPCHSYTIRDSETGELHTKVW